MSHRLIRSEVEMAASTVSFEKNIIKLGEEAAELAAIILKGLFTGKFDYDRIAEETADVEICIEILRRQAVSFENNIYRKKVGKADRMRYKRLYESDRNAKQGYDLYSGGVIPSFKGFSFSTDKRDEPDEDCMPAPQEESRE